VLILKKDTPDDPQRVLQRLMALCSRKECCVWHIQQKLNRTNLPPEQQNEIMDRLLRERFVDNRRFVEIYCRDRCGRAQWGWNKIQRGLTLWGLKDYLEEARAMCLELDPNRTALPALAKAKWSSLTASGTTLDYRQRQKLCAKLSRYLLGKGYPSDDVFAQVRLYFEPS